MNKRFADIARRKQALIERCAQERAEISIAYNKIRSPIELSTFVLGLGRTLQTHPMIAAGVSSLLASGYAAKLLRSAGDALKLWKLLRPAWAWFKARRRTR